MFKTRLKFLLALAALALCWAGPAQALQCSWSLDQAKFHASAHGRMSCLECHEQVAADPHHPQPGGVNRNCAKTFKPKSCTRCHDNVPGDLAAGRHGGREVKDPARYELCITCHNPHIQPALDEAKLKFAPGIVRSRQCGVCHQPEKSLPRPGNDEKPCYLCHVEPLNNPGRELLRQKALCLDCHASYSAQKDVLRFDPMTLAKGPHAGLGCLDCHKGADRFPHSAEQKVDCLACHPPHHDESLAGDLHQGVSCQACHLKGVKAIRRTPGGPVTAQVLDQKGIFTAHQLNRPGRDEACARCHYPGNRLGAAAMVLPQKSLLCLPCHAATFTVNLSDYVSLAGLGIFLLGLAGAISFWGSGRGAGVWGSLVKALFSAKIGRILKVFVLDGLLQRRLWRISPARGLIHALIFLPFLFRFTWGLVALLASLWLPKAAFGWEMLYKNQPLTAFFFDLTGLLVLVGAALAALRRLRSGQKPVPGLPRPDWIGMGLILGIVLAGFVLEALRIAMTGYPTDAGYAFLGYVLSLAVSPGPWLGTAYGYLWYVHAILCAAFAAYLPFGRMFHIYLAPLLLAAEAADQGHEEDR